MLRYVNTRHWMRLRMHFLNVCLAHGVHIREAVFFFFSCLHVGQLCGNYRRGARLTILAQYGNGSLLASLQLGILITIMSGVWPLSIFVLWHVSVSVFTM